MKALFSTSVLLVPFGCLPSNYEKHQRDTRKVAYGFSFGILELNYITSIKTQYSEFSELYKFEYSSFCLSLNV